ncbi:hypothetical protein C823_006145 [Eubacterium plexicaudatum ASF492]|nr:hypothetical protein C823_006145 [Eubacterium plexicaudatum ASF492]
MPCFCALKPKMESWFDPKEDQWVGIPKDTLADGENAENPQTDVEQEETDQTQAKPDHGDKKKETVYITEKKDMTLDDYQILQNELYRIGNKVNQSIVTVTGIKERVDIFDSPYESPGQASGLIIGNNKKELLILTEYQVIEDVKSIRVTFINNDTLDASLIKYDGNTGIAVLGVPVEKIAKTTMDQIETAVLGNSLNLRQGKMVVALGSPLGTNYSILTGNITSVTNTITTEDRNYTVFTTNIVANAKGNGVLINTDGEVIGLVLKSPYIQKEQNTLTAVSISELKEIIELLSNGLNVPYMGVKGSTVTDAISREYNIPKGVYIKEAVVDAPAMMAGLQTGDVIVAIGKEEVLSMEDYQRMILKLKKGDQVKITANRQNTEGYKKFTCTVEVGVLR